MFAQAVPAANGSTQRPRMLSSCACPDRVGVKVMAVR
jgi:hypothetical protein